jgi:hypothetical protein
METNEQKLARLITENPGLEVVVGVEDVICEQLGIMLPLWIAQIVSVEVVGTNKTAIVLRIGIPKDKEV